MAHRRARIRPVALSLLAVAALIPGLEAAAVRAGDGGPAPAFDPKLFQSLTYRNIGPFRGGRVTAVTGVPGERETFYMGSTGGGVWKTTDGGGSWRNVSDESFKSASVGAVAVAASDHNVVYAGMGSACVRGNVSPGDGVYRSTDAGKTWVNIGLKDAGQIARIRVHPADPDVLYVAALGHAFGPNAERGVFRSKDGGKSWTKVLFVNDQVGAVDLAMDPRNPRNLYAAMYRSQRKPWTYVGGGEGSGLQKSTDGGETWKPLTEGLPAGPIGRIGVSVSGADSDRVWALVEAEKGGLYRSDDGGKKFRLINADRNFRQRAWYYTHVFADPADRETLYILNTGLWRSTDAGKEFTPIRGPHGDHHDLWISPDDPQVLINGNDGGANVSYNGGRTWSTQGNQPTAEFYRVAVSGAFPYRVFGCQQDNSCVSLPSRTSASGIAREDWYVIGGCESGHVAVDPRDPEITYAGCYGGSIGRQDHRTGQEREVMPWPQIAVGQAPKDLKYRYQWNAPLRISAHDPNVLYSTSQVVLRSRDQGQSWEEISPDLTRNDASKLGYSGEPITRDNTGVEVYGTIFAFEESPQREGQLWAGSDDGRVHLSRDGGKTWEDVTPKQMPEWGQVNMIEPSTFDAGRAFLAVTRYKLDDFRPYVFRTDDFGKSWKLLTDSGSGIPQDRFVRVVREDPGRRGLLYAGTEFGMYLSFDDGKRWQSFQQKLPVVPIADLAVTQNDLVVATQGRSFWILDDLTPLHELNDAIAKAPVHLFEPRDAWRFGGGGGGEGGGGGGATGQNPPGGAMIDYTLAEKPAEGKDLTIEILDAGGEVLRRMSSVQEEKKAPNPFRRFFPELATPAKLGVEPGMNRWVWDLRLGDAELVDDAVIWGSTSGPTVPPGKYRARLTYGDTVQVQEFEVRKDPRLKTTPEEYQQQYALARKIWNDLSESHRALNRIRDARKQVDDLTRRLEAAGKGDGLAGEAKGVKEKLSSIEGALHQTGLEASQDVLNFPPMLDNHFAGLLGVVESADARPTNAALARYAELRAELDRLLGDLRSVMGKEMASFNEMVRSKGAAPVILAPESGSSSAQ